MTVFFFYTVFAWDKQGPLRGRRSQYAMNKKKNRLIYHKQKKFFCCFIYFSSVKTVNILFAEKSSLICHKPKNKYELPHDKTNKMSVRPAKTQISLGIRPVWSESSLSAWRNLGSLATHWAHSEDSDQNGQMPRLIWVFAGCTLILLVLSCRVSDCLVYTIKFM